MTMSRRTPHLAKQIRALSAGDTARLSPAKIAAPTFLFPFSRTPFPFFRSKAKAAYRHKKTLEQTLKRKIGSEGRIRTCDQVINSHLRYHCATSERKRNSFEIGSEGRIRTCDQVINSHLRYHCATSERGMRFLKNWWRVRVTIPRHADYDSAALPTELTRQAENSAQYSKSLRYPSSIFSFAR